VANTVATGTARQESDVDLLITVKPGRMWTARLLATGVAFAMGRFRHGQRVADRMCLSFYLADDALDLEPLALEGDDPYLAHWAGSLGTIWERRPERGSGDAGLLGQRLFAANPWINQLMPNLAPQQPSDRRRVPPFIDRLTNPLRSLTERLLSGTRGTKLEQRLRARQLRRMGKFVPSEIRTATQHIVISDSILKFHEQDRRTWFRERTLSTYQRLSDGEMPYFSSEQPEVSVAGLVVQSVGATVVS
jgi:hypothetical protein